MRTFVIIGVMFYAATHGVDVRDAPWQLQCFMSLLQIFAFVADFRDAFGRNCQHKLPDNVKGGVEGE